MVLYTQQKLGEGFIYFIVTLCTAALFVHFQSAAVSYPHSLECSMSTILQLAHQGQTIPQSDVPQSPVVSTQLQINVFKLQCKLHSHCCRAKAQVAKINRHYSGI
jgi:hypothetical protein